MLVKSLFETSIQTLQGKKSVKENEIFDCSLSTYNSLKTMYKSRFEFLPLYVVAKKDIIQNWKEYKKWKLEEVTFEKFKTLKSLYLNVFDFIETVENYNKFNTKIQETVKIWVIDSKTVKNDIIQGEEVKTASKRVQKKSN